MLQWHQPACEISSALWCLKCLQTLKNYCLSFHWLYSIAYHCKNAMKTSTSLGGQWHFVVPEMPQVAWLHCHWQHVQECHQGVHQPAKPGRHCKYCMRTLPGFQLPGYAATGCRSRKATRASTSLGGQWRYSFTHSRFRYRASCKITNG